MLAAAVSPVPPDKKDRVSEQTIDSNNTFSSKLDISQTSTTFMHFLGELQIFHWRKHTQATCSKSLILLKKKKQFMLRIEKNYLRGCQYCPINHTHTHTLNPAHSNTFPHHSKPTQAQKPCKIIPVHAGTNKRTQEAQRPVSQPPLKEMQECILL